MDPGRRQMVSRQGQSRREVTGPRMDANTRVTRSPRPDARSAAAQGAARYLTQDELSRRFVADEDKFVLKQAKKKADIRVREGRAKAVDRLAFNLRYLDHERDVFDDDEGDVNMELQAPAAVLEDLDVAELGELQSDMGSFLALETDATNRRYWEALKTLCSDKQSERGPRGRQDRAISVVKEDIDKILSPKTYEQLEAVERQVKNKLGSNEEIDSDYWEQLLAHVEVCKAKAVLAQVFQAICEAREKLVKEQRESGQSQPAGQDWRKRQVPGAGDVAAAGSAAGSAAGEAQAAGNEDVSQETKALYEREAARGISENEEIFTAEEAVPNGSKPTWAGQYRARKPRYFNRVQMGYEWNKYNQTHYDHDNPPPKVVQGYKFNIFYPELMDKTKTPTFRIIREHGRRRGESMAAAGEEDTCLIHFVAGPPYEDIAFRIVDREWDYSAKRERGYKSTFDKGILQLHFQFKRIFYRK